MLKLTLLTQKMTINCQLSQLSPTLGYELVREHCQISVVTTFPTVEIHSFSNVILFLRANLLFPSIVNMITSNIHQHSMPVQLCGKLILFIIFTLFIFNVLVIDKVDLDLDYFLKDLIAI